MAQFKTGAEVSLRHNGSQKLATTSTGIDVTGTVVADELDIINGASRCFFRRNGTETELKLIGGTNEDSALYFGDVADNVRVGLRHDSSANSLRFMGYNNSEAMVIDSNLNVGIGTASPATALDVTGTVTATGLDVTGNATGQLDSSLGGFFLPQNPEATHVKGPTFFNDISYARLRNATVSVDVDGTAMTDTTYIDAMLNADGDFWWMATAGVTTATITITDLPKGLNYGSFMGITFGDSAWRANSITLEHSTDNGSTWTTARSTTSNTKEYFLDSFSSSSTATNALRWTLEDFNSTNMRVVSLFAYNYNSSGMAGLYVTRDGGDIYNDLSFNDNVKATFGADLEIHHNGTDSFIDEKGTGWLYIRGNNTVIGKYTGEIYMKGIADGAVELYHNNVKKLDTTSTGIDVTGTVTADGLTVDGVARIQGTATGLVINETDTTDLNSYITSNNGDLKIMTVNDAFSSFDTRLLLDHATGDISFYEDTGTTAKFFWDASAESLGLGTNAPKANAGLHIQGANGASGATTNVAANEFFIDNNGNTGMTLGSATTGTGYYAFADSNTALVGGLFYDHSTDDMGFRVTSATRMTIDSTGKVGIGTAAPATALDVTGTVTATSYAGDGSALTGIAAGATGGGSDDIFYENGQNVTTNYTITNGKNAMSAGPITVDSGVTVTVGAGETWTVV